MKNSRRRQLLAQRGYKGQRRMVERSNLGGAFHRHSHRAVPLTLQGFPKRCARCRYYLCPRCDRHGLYPNAKPRNDPNWLYAKCEGCGAYVRYPHRKVIAAKL